MTSVSDGAASDGAASDGVARYVPVATSEVELDEANEQAASPALEVILLVGSEPKRTVSAAPTLSVLQLKELAFPELHGTKRIRMIHCGHLLADQTLLADTGLERSPFVHVAISDKLSGDRAAPADLVAIDIDDDDPVTMEEADRRLAILLSEREDPLIGQDPEHNQDPDLWMNTPEGDQSDFLWGFIFGSCLGYIAIIWLWQPRVPRRQKLGIMTGILVFLITGMSRGPARRGAPGNEAGDHPTGANSGTS